MATYNALLHKYIKNLEMKEIPLETVKVFLFELCNEFDINLYLEMDNEANPALEKKFEEGMVRILNHEPLNYVLGYSYFYGYKFIVNEGCLIPRYETEELVSNILIECDNYFKDLEHIEACDIGTGSGAIAIALTKEESKMHITATDISEDALSVAKENAKLNEADVDFLCGNMVDPLIEKGIKVDLLISNPPYIPQEEELDTSVKDFEPHVALFGGSDGLKFYKEIFENAHKILKPKGLMAFEIGWNQKENLINLLKDYFNDFEAYCFKDINQKDRMLFVKVNTLEDKQ